MKKKFMSLVMAGTLTAVTLTGCNNEVVLEPVAEPDVDVVVDVDDTTTDVDVDVVDEVDDQALADEVAELIDAIYVQERTADTDAQCKAAKEAWDALTDEQKELVEGEDADPDYF